MKVVFATALFFAIGAGSMSARAQDEPATPVVQAPDVVLTTDGSLYRGTIAEKTGEHVEILLISGSLRTVPMTNVKYAGPVEGLPHGQAPAPESERAPQQATEKEAPANTSSRQEENVASDTNPAVTVHAGESRLSLRATQPGITYHRRAASTSGVAVGSAVGGGASGPVTGTVALAHYAEHYQEMCTAPCEVTMAAGTHTLALSRMGGSPVRAAPVSLPAEDVTLTATYTSRAGTRTAGVILLVGGLVVGSAVMATTAVDDDAGLTPIWIGGGILMGGLLIGFPLLRTSDEASIQVEGTGDLRSAPRSTGRGVSVRHLF
jgi:hypothetical protein